VKDMSKYIIQAPIRSHIAQEQDMKNQWIPTDLDQLGNQTIQISQDISQDITRLIYI
jgi:hypothetical protein